MTLKKRLLVIGIAAITIVATTGATYKNNILDGATVYKNSTKAVMYVRALNENGELRSSGSGFCVDKDGTFVTASHVVRGANSVNVVTDDGDEIKNISIESQNDITDVTIMKLPKKSSGYKYIELSSVEANPGGKVYAIGYPLKNAKIISDGIVANTETMINGISRTLVTSDFANGMSGGPVISESGKVIGLCSATLRTMNGVSTTPTLAQIKDEIAKTKK